jgi:acetoin utilization deacetylase AcuC-like enzyme
MLLHSGVYREPTQDLMRVADETCGGRLFLSHEGGYSTGYVPFCGLAVREDLSGSAKGVEDPVLPFFEGMGYQDLQAPQEVAICAAAVNLRIALTR